MMTTFFALLVVMGTTFLVASNLRVVAQDTLQAMHHAASRILGSGCLRRKLAFAALWGLIFALASL